LKAVAYRNTVRVTNKQQQKSVRKGKVGRAVVVLTMVVMIGPREVNEE
jgi:hypothetical protein